MRWLEFEPVLEARGLSGGEGEAEVWGLRE